MAIGVEELAKRLLTAGIGALFLTEDALRALVSEFKLPKEALSSILASAGKTRDEFIERLSQEILSRVMKDFRPEELAREIVSKHDFKFEVKVSLAPKESR